jgi:hypothetical protein
VGDVLARIGVPGEQSLIAQVVDDDDPVRMHLAVESDGAALYGFGSDAALRVAICVLYGDSVDGIAVGECLVVCDLYRHDEWGVDLVRWDADVGASIDTAGSDLLGVGSDGPNGEGDCGEDNRATVCHDSLS